MPPYAEGMSLNPYESPPDNPEPPRCVSGTTPSALLWILFIFVLPAVALVLLPMLPKAFWEAILPGAAVD